MSGLDPEYVNPLVEELVPNPPAQTPDLTLINGYVGPSDDPKKVRIYRSSSANRWLTVDRDKIARYEHIEKHTGAPWGDDLIWLPSQYLQGLTPESSAEASRPGLGRIPGVPVRPDTAEGGRPVLRCACCGSELASGGPPIGGPGPTGAGNFYPGI